MTYLLHKDRPDYRAMKVQDAARGNPWRTEFVVAGFPYLVPRDLLDNEPRRGRPVGIDADEERSQKKFDLAERLAAATGKAVSFVWPLVSYLTLSRINMLIAEAFSDNRHDRHDLARVLGPSDRPAPDRKRRRENREDGAWPVSDAPLLLVLTPFGRAPAGWHNGLAALAVLAFAVAKAPRGLLRKIGAIINENAARPVAMKHADMPGMRLTEG